MNSTSVAPASSLVCLPLPTDLGEFVTGYSERGLAELHFPSRKAGMPMTAVVPAEIRWWHETTTSAVREILSGRTPQQLPPLDLSRGTSFQQSVWRALTRIPLGQTRSYGEIARAVGKPKALRAVGGACGANPIPILVPCHRVLAAHHQIGGFSGGRDWKRKLLAREGVMLPLE